MATIDDLLTLKANGKFKIHIEKIKKHIPSLRNSSNPFEMMDQITNLYQNIQIEKKQIPSNQSWLSNSSFKSSDTNVTKQPLQAHYIVPMHKMSYIETLHKLQLQENLSMLIQQEQYLGNIKLQQTNTILRAGFPTIKQQKQKRSQSLDVKMTTNESSQALDISNDDDGNKLLPEQSIKVFNFSHPQNQSPNLPGVKSYLNRKGTKFGSSPRENNYEQCSPGPAQYLISRFGENDFQQSQKKVTNEHLQLRGLFEGLRLQSKVFLPDLERKQSAPKKQIKSKPKQKRNESLIDRFGQPLYPISMKVVQPGPQDYGNVNLSSIENKIKRIQQEKLIKSEIKQWVEKNHQ